MSLLGSKCALVAEMGVIATDERLARAVLAVLEERSDEEQIRKI